MSAPPRAPIADRTLFAGVFAVSWATLVLEVSLVRVLSFTIWHHFGYVVISTALLGFATAGTLLAVAPRLGTHDLRATLGVSCTLAALTTVGVLLLIAGAPLDPMQIVASRKQAVLFVAYLLAAATPFFFGGLAVSLALRSAARAIDRLIGPSFSSSFAGAASSTRGRSRPRTSARSPRWCWRRCS